MLELEPIIYVLKTFFISVFTYYISLRIINRIINRKEVKTWICVLTIFLIGILSVLIKVNLNDFMAVFIPYILMSFVVAISTKSKIGYSMLITIISLGINYIVYFISLWTAFVPSIIWRITSDFINLLIIIPIHTTFIYLIFKIKRFKNGFMFLQDKSRNEYIDTIVLSISVVIMFAYVTISIPDDSVTKHLSVELAIITVIMAVVIQKALTMHYKQKLLEDTLKQYENENKEKTEEIEKLKLENLNFSKISHEFDNRQKALELKVKELSENGNVADSSAIDRINNLSKEYSEAMEKTKYVSKLKSTDVEGLDDMFKYMQSECKKNNIEFSLQINGNINYMVNNVIKQDRLETLIGDHIKDAIIAINSGCNEYRSIMAVLGIKDDCYRFAVYDSGIEFKIDTLLNLGIEPITTHKDTGGSGLGFMTTFETLKECKASLIIEENKPSTNTYAKSVVICFDGKGEYVISTYRFEEIEERNKDKRVIVRTV